MHDGLDLQRGEVLADAHVRTAAERDPRKRMALDPPDVPD